MTDEQPDELLSGVVSDSEGLFPVVGTDRTPTPEMIAQGAFGNGSWDLNDGSVQVAYEQRHREIKDDRDERRQFFNEQAKDALADAVALHHAIIRRGLEVMQRIEQPDPEVPVTSKDMTILSMAQKSSKELADRGMGRATATREEASTDTVLSMIVRKPDA